MEESSRGSKSHCSNGPIDKFTSFEKGKSKQTDIDSVMRKEKATRLKEYVPVPFNKVEKDSFAALLEAADQYGPRGEPPTRYELGECLLTKELQETKTRMKMHEDEWKTNGCSIMTNAWSDRQRGSILNLFVNSKLGTVILSSKESSDEAHTSEQIYEYVETCIKQVGPENVVQIVTNDDCNNVGVAKLLKVKRPTIFWTSCAAQAIKLMLEAIGGLKTYKTTLEKARKITEFIYAHHKLLALMRQYTQKRDIVRPGVSRFASSFLNLHSLLEKRVQLRQMFMSAQWESSNLSKSKKGKEVYALVIENKTWAGVTRCLSVFEPLVKILRMVDSDSKPSMGFLHGEFKKAQHQIKDALNDNQKFYDPIMEIISTKMKGRLDSCLHLAAYVLNPFYLYNDINIQHDAIVNDAVVEVIETLFPDDFEMQHRIVNEELPLYKGKQGKFSRVVAIKGCEVNVNKFDPASWWSNYGASTPNLRKVAMRILSLTTSSSGCERRKERGGHDLLLSNDDESEAQDWFSDEGLTFNLIGDAMGADDVLEPHSSSRTQELSEEDFESESEEEVNEDFEYESDDVQIIEHNEH
ncbi:uncharacterized protein [Rutidosis leptorrhynchoides]